MFCYYQPNNKDDENVSSDCVIRALTKLLNLDWKTVFEELYCIAKSKQRMLNDGEVVEQYLTDNHFVKHIIHRKRNEKQLRLKEFAEQYNMGAYFCWARSHVVAVIDGIIYDSWDSSNICLYEYWKVE